MNRTKHYKTFSFRLNDPTIDAIRDLKRATGKSYNLLFLAMIKKFNKKIYAPTISSPID